MKVFYIHVFVCNTCGAASLVVSSDELAGARDEEQLRRGKDCPVCLGGQVHHVGRVKVDR